MSSGGAVAHILHSVSYIGILLILFAESGLLVGFFLPGDSLLFTAGFFAHGGTLSLWGVLAAAVVGAVTGDSVGYWIGKRFGPSVFKRNNRFLKEEYVERTRGFFDRYGRLALVVARFVPVARTVAPTMAGVTGMHYPHFLAFNAVGGVLWAVVVSLLGYFLGGLVPNIDRYLTLVVTGAVLLSLIPAAITLIRSRRKSEN